MGVSSAMPSSRCRASWTSASVGAVRSVAKMEDLFHYLPHRGQRIQLPPLDRVEQPPQLGVVRHGLLQMRLRAARRNREHLARKGLATALVEPAGVSEVRAVLLDFRPELATILARRGVGQNDRSPPRPLAVEREDLA